MTKPPVDGRAKAVPYRGRLPLQATGEDAHADDGLCSRSSVGLFIRRVSRARVLRMRSSYRERSVQPRHCQTFTWEV